eukprot:GFUD01001664.1.p1 GENE.GFUD01001664.1~~GFUD01001664.1.p1  ORF type:complete len:742 (+),score=116.54 GFUD01001664.1:253-2478(+)
MATTMSANITSEEPANSTPILAEIGSKTSRSFSKMDISTNNSRPPGGVDLSLEEEMATTKFLENVNKWRAARELTELSWSSAVKFLMARKFNVERALVLYQQHEIMRIREGLTYFDHSSGPLQAELKRGKFTILQSRDPNGATIALFNLSLHEPSEVTHQTVLQCVVFQLDVALEEIETQRNGLVFVYNMSSSKYSNFDYDLSQKMLTLLKGCYPARLKKVLIVTAPLWFKAPFKVLRLFVREKLRDRVFTVSTPQLLLHVDPTALPPDLGGTSDYNHQKWLEKCHQVTEGKAGSMLTMTHSTSQHRSPQESPTHLPDQDLLGITNGVDAFGFDGDDCDDDDITEPIAPCTSLSPSINRENGKNEMFDIRSIQSLEEANLAEISTSDIPAGIECATHVENQKSPIVTESAQSAPLTESVDHCASIIDDTGSSLEDFIVYVRNKTRNGLFDEYQEIKSQPPDGTFDHARLAENLAKNRYTDVLCYDHTRVILARDDNDPDSDYCNANFVDGYKQRNAFISTQGPLPRTFSDTWQMVWEQKVVVIVMTTRTVERHRTKCGQYWPELEGSNVTYGVYNIQSENIENYEDFIVTDLKVTNTVTGEERQVCHFQFTSWPDYGTPDSALSMLQFLQCVREKQAELVVNMTPVWEGHTLGPPIVVHCSAGIGRTGTFCTLDIAIRKFEDTGKVDIRKTVECIRAQRAFSIQMPDQYVFCHLAFLEYVLNMGYAEEIDLTGFDEEVLPE